MRIIGLTGVARSGKDTVANLIEDGFAGLPQTVIREGFAWKLKLSAMRCFKPNATLEEALEWSDWFKTEGCLMEFPEDTGYGEGGDTITGRAFLQNYGTEAHRDVFGEDFWLDSVLPTHTEYNNLQERAQIVCERKDCDVLAIPDVRFDNEARRIRDCRGEVWQIVRPGVEAVNAHASDAGITGSLVSEVIVNDGTLDDLKAKVWRLL